MNPMDALNRKFADTPRVSSVTGVFVAMADGLARVNVQGSTVDVRCDGWAPPVPGMPVRVETVNGAMRVVGPARVLTPRGEVLEALESNTRALVSVDGQSYNLPVMAPYSPLPTDQVVINWESGFILGEQASSVEEEETAPAQPPVTQFSGLLIQARGSGKYDFPNGNWWGSGDVRASNNNAGAWFYHNTLAGLAGANVSTIELYLPPPWRAVGAAFVGLHPHASRPGGAPSIGSTVPLNQRSGWVALPAHWGNFLRDNPSHGIGVTSGAGDNQWAGVPQDALSGALRFAGTR
jgi:membrane protein implicated in regulation of membrane protease activity